MWFWTVCGGIVAVVGVAKALPKLTAIVVSISQFIVNLNNIFPVLNQMATEFKPDGNGGHTTLKDQTNRIERSLKEHIEEVGKSQASIRKTVTALKRSVGMLMRSSVPAWSADALAKARKEVAIRCTVLSRGR